jgi:hypothetical protein
MIDNGRGHNNYGVAYFWVMILHKLPDGRVVVINLSDGLGSKFKSLDKASEDFITIDDKHFKLDVSELDYYKDDYNTKKTVRTAVEDEHYKRVYPDRECFLTFTPEGMIQDGVNAGIIAFKQYLVYGHFDGYC